MPMTSRRGLLAVLASSAAALPLGALGAAPARAAAQTAVPPFTPAPGTPGGLSSVTTAPLDASFFSQVSLGALSAAVLPGTPERTEVTSGGTRVALLTKGARTVLLPGPGRTFREDKQGFTDDFARTIPDPAKPEDQQVWGWGSTPGGGSWVTVNGAAGDYRVDPAGGGSGIITVTGENSSRHVTVRDGEIADVDVRAVARFDKAPAGAAQSFALSFGYQNSDNSYRARLYFLTSGAVELRLEKEQANAVTDLAAAVTVNAAAGAGSSWTVRVRREGSRMWAKAWRTDLAEPASWMAEADDSTFAKGRVGVRAIVSKGSGALPVRCSVDLFQVDAANWAAPPSVTHHDWVRVLPEPFDGAWTPDVEQRIRAWAGSTAPDVLAYAAMFLAGAPEVRSGSGATAGSRVLGEAGYGYLDPQGYRYEGADFHEYMNRAWTFPDGTTVPASSKQVGNLDCSGYVRMVYGHHMGVPLSARADGAGSRLPRKSRDMVDGAPGARIDQAVAKPFTPPAATLLQPGDLLLFNADSTDDEPRTDTLTIDHVGIYLGRDDRGNRRFLSSRKTGNGPTMSDLGGASVLEGSGVYARTLHTVHRL
ncbi:NlpC/P60 family protein [Streptomyces sp. NPDC048111]|uniref:NlpC/P60 family protein n=1 Tax=Streptomyces sp. NPDC048111 TaxID=3365500 RepID=UPI00370FDFE0